VPSEFVGYDTTRGLQLKEEKEKLERKKEGKVGWGRSPFTKSSSTKVPGKKLAKVRTVVIAVLTRYPHPEFQCTMNKIHSQSQSRFTSAKAPKN